MEYLTSLVRFPRSFLPCCDHLQTQASFSKQTLRAGLRLVYNLSDTKFLKTRRSYEIPIAICLLLLR